MPSIPTFHPPVGDPAAAVPLTLTRRGRLLLVGLPMMLMAAALLMFTGFFTAPAQAADQGGGETQTVSVNVGPGETIWALATEFAPERDPRDVVAEIVELNGLGTSVVQAGQELDIPIGG